VIGEMFSAVLALWHAVEADSEWMRWIFVFSTLFCAGAAGRFVRKMWESKQRATHSRDPQPGAASSPGVSR
jgi:hypothetical protein